MELIQLLLFIIIVLTLLNGLLYFKRLIKLQEETNYLLKKLNNKNESESKKDSKSAMPTEDLEKLKASYMANMNINKYVK
tara:strand:- start:1500 stop:1739 length:240 start_codon:yes stop_codon:yes gene_type:complete